MKYQVKKYIDYKNAEAVLNAFETGWDYGVEQFEKLFGKNEATADYYGAYKFMKNNDPDSSKCFVIRQKAVEKIIKQLEAIKEN